MLVPEPRGTIPPRYHSLPLRGEGGGERRRMRCSAKRVTKHKVTFSFVNGSASGTYTSSPPAGGAVSLRLVSVAVPQAELRFSVSPGDRFIAAPLLRSPQGEAKVGIMPRGLRTAFAPNTETFSAVHNISVVWLSHPARSPGGSRGAEPH